jgi:hypothetical protein
VSKRIPPTLALLAALGIGFATGIAPDASALTTPRATVQSYWLLSSTGQVFTYGKARNYGSEYHKKFKGFITVIKGTRDGKGYWIITTKTHYSFGDASHFKYIKGGTTRYTGHAKPRGLHGKVVSIATARPASGTKTTTTKTTTTPVKSTTTSTSTTKTTPTTPTGPTCSSVATSLSAGSHVIAHESAPFSMSLPSTGPNGTWNWTVTAGHTTPGTNLAALPNGLAVTGASIVGTPTTDGQAGWLTLTAVDSACSSNPVSVQQFFNIEDPSMAITTSSLASGQAGVAYSQTVTATGGYNGGGSLYDWSATGLPAGLSINSGTGAITGTPAASDAAANPQAYSVNITVADPNGTVPSDSQGYTVTISPTALTFVTNTLTAVQGQPYNGTVVMAGAVAPYHQSLANGSTTPAGLSFNNGTITGTPTAGAGSYTFTIQASDSQTFSYEATETFHMEIAPSAVGPNPSIGSSDPNSIWSGYVEQGSSAFTSASTTLTVPALANANIGNSVSPWVGIGGYCNCGLLQAGVTAFANSSNGQITYQGWWEDYPVNAAQDLVTVNAGDTINIYIWQVSAGQWEITLNDITNGVGFQVQQAYTGNTSTAEWILEDNGGGAPVGYTSSSTFSNLTASQASTGMVEQTDPGGTPGPISGSGFTATTGY